MILFHTSKPRGFEHQFIYVDERKEQLRQMKQHAKNQLLEEQKKNVSTPCCVAYTQIHGMFHNKERRHYVGRTLFYIWILLLFIVLIFLSILMVM